MKKKWMNRKAGIGVLAAALTVGTAGTVVAAASGNNTTTVPDHKVTAVSSSNNAVTVPDNSKVIGIQRAEAIALQKVPDGTMESIELERKQGKLYYEVDVERSNGSDVDVHIDALTGAVVRTVNDDNDDDDAYSVSQNNSQSSATASNAKVKSAEQAVTIAKQLYDGTVTDVEREREDGRTEYEVEVRFNGGKATVAIDEMTGKVTKVDKDYDDHDDDQDDD